MTVLIILITVIPVDVEDVVDGSVVPPSAVSEVRNHDFAVLLVAWESEVVLVSKGDSVVVLFVFEDSEVRAVKGDFELCREVSEIQQSLVNFLNRLLYLQRLKWFLQLIPTYCLLSLSL